MDPMLERRRRMILAGQDPGPMPMMSPMMLPGAPQQGAIPPMPPPAGVRPLPIGQPGLGGEPPLGLPPGGPGSMPPPPGMGMGGAAPPGPGMMPPPMGGAPVPPGPVMAPQTPSMPPGGAPPGLPPGIASYAQPAQPAHPAWFPGPPMPKPRPPPRRRSAVEELGERMGQPPAPPAPAHEPEPARVPQPIGDASGYDPTAAYAGARGSTYEMPAFGGGTGGGIASGAAPGGGSSSWTASAGDRGFGHSANLMDWISARLGWR